MKTENGELPLAVVRYILGNPPELFSLLFLKQIFGSVFGWLVGWSIGWLVWLGLLLV